MKRIINTLVCVAAALFSYSCQEQLIVDMPVNESIVLDLSSGSSTRAADEDYESYVNHIDVMIFKVGSDDKPADLEYHEKISVDNNRSVTLSAKKSDFEEDVTFFVYLIANSSLDFSKISDFSALNDMKQEDMLLHLSALNLSGVNNPKYFLMDAIAEGADGKSPIVLNDGSIENDTVLSAVLKRAAAKVKVNIAASANVNFMPYSMAEGSEGGLYYVRNLPYDTHILAETKAASDILNAKLWTTDKTDSEYFTWSPETAYGKKNVSLVTYVYPHSWQNASILEKETCIVMNLPMEYNDGEGNVVVYHNSWYKIPMTDNATFERNHYYEININLNRPGAITESEPVKVENLYYSVLDWTSVEVNAGGSVTANYLQLNTDHVDIYNTNTDSKSLTYASSSEIADIELLEAYYYDKYDVKKDVRDAVKKQIHASAQAGILNGGITIHSPFVAKSETEIEQEIANLGARPVVPELPVLDVENPEVQEVSEPDPDDFLKKSTSRTEYQYVKQGNSYVFQKRTKQGKNWTDWTADSETQKAYDSALADYQKWVVWKGMSVDEKKAAIAAYNAAVSEYNSLLAEYNKKVDELAKYEADVASIRSGSGNSHGNAIRYMKFRVTNSTGQTAEFTVSQYPTIYITNKHGSYSYRSDFGGTSYGNGIGEENISGANWNNDGTWSYSWTSSGSYFFGSKVAKSSGSSYTINYAYYNERDNDKQTTSNINSLNNPRMYHVHVTATSSVYTVAIPALDASGYTASTPENTKLVSPSFMIASQLGATLSPSGGVEQAKSHCEQYIEVGADGREYDDWRLPTAAEIDIIIQHQSVSDAMDVVLTGSAYYCAYNTDANGKVIYTKATGMSGSQNAVRCIRDEY